jgi:2-methylcitrate dehydratase PrpD
MTGPRPDSAPHFAAARIAAFACGMRAAALPRAVIEAAKLHLLDALGVALAAASLATRPRLDRAVAALGRGEEATGLGLAAPIPAPAAALLNGALIHALEFDDTHMAAVVHGSAVVAPCALAVAEREARTGADLIAAFALGWEVLARIGLAGPGVFQARGFHSTAVAGAPVAALVAGRLMGLDARTLTDALGIAGSQAGGIFEFLSDGSTVKMLHGGWPAHAGVMAAEFARCGVTGPASVFEGPRGLFRAFADAPGAGERLACALDDLGTHWLLPEAAFKPYPCCHYNQAAIECVRRLMDGGVTAAEVERIECAVPAEVAWLVCEPWAAKLAPDSGHVAKFSLPYCVAAMLVDGDVDVGTFDRERADSRLRPMMERMSFRPMADSGFPQRYPARVCIRTRDGRMHEAEVQDVLGSPRRAFSAEQVRAKFRRNAARTLRDEAVEAVEDAVRCLQDASDLAPLTRALRAVR